MTWANAKTVQVAADLFKVRVCIVCHEVGRTATNAKPGKEPDWTIAPVNIATTWLPKARFDHLKHRTSKCADCHDAEKSHSSADISIPDIVTCRQCHGGSKPAPNKVVSTCVACHGFHLPGHAPFGQSSGSAAPRGDMSPPGRPKGEYRSAQHEGAPVSPPGRPKGEYRSAQHEGTPVSPQGHPKGEYRSAQHEGTPVSAVTVGKESP